MTGAAALRSPATPVMPKPVLPGHDERGWQAQNEAENSRNRDCRAHSRLPRLYIFPMLAAISVILAGCMSGPTSDDPKRPGVEAEPDSEQEIAVRNPRAGDGPDAGGGDPIHEERRLDTLAASPMGCIGPFIFDPAVILGLEGSTYAYAALDAASGGFLYTLTAGTTGQELGDYWHAIEFLRNGTTWYQVPAPQMPGTMNEGIVPDSPVGIYSGHCGGGAGTATFTSYVPEVTA